MSSANQGGYSVSGRDSPTQRPQWPMRELLADGELYVVAGKSAERWVLDLVGRFSALQGSIERLISSYVELKSPEFAKILQQKHFNRLTDEDRWTYVKAVARDIGYEGRLMPSASDSFWRCKRVRDFASHHTDMVLARDLGSRRYFYPVPENRQKPQIPDPLTPETFRSLVAECRWLEAFINYVAYASGIQFISSAPRINQEGEPEIQYLEVLEPPSLPISADWEAKGLVRNLESPFT